ncbi:RING-H2 finger protein ATL13-like [Phoenix dactylifera]|uniref:RING-type E3 ubiquitin transferase n=1 Tax=Phoenix dactylifera TaxID=42345 RepID=A0A8B9AF77_PHODC|nr:RING-H2 finger protein ATL13-like [Phoenix dactylifera]
MDIVMLGSTKEEDLLSPIPHPSQPRLPAAPLPSNSETDSGHKISSTIFLVMLLLAGMGFLVGLFHLLVKYVRYVRRPNDRSPEYRDNATVLQGQLQQLFHLHDSGVDQSFIDSLPVFPYKAIIGLRDPFDCAVCLCEFKADDKLRLLPKCSHAFHLDCIDTWLLCHSTCPLCRRNLLPGFSPSNGCSPACFSLESRGESSRREFASDRVESGLEAPMDFPGEDGLGTSSHECSQKPWETGDKEDLGSAISEASEEKVVPVKLGKLKNMDLVAGGGEGSSSGSNNMNERRCLSMGSYKYVVDENSLLQVAIKPQKQKTCITNPEHGRSISARFKELDPPSKSESSGYGGSASISANAHKKESFSFSKTWLRSKKGKLIAQDFPRRASAFQLPLYQPSAVPRIERGGSSRTVSEFDIAGLWQ